MFDWGDTLVHQPGLTTDLQGHLACLEAVYSALCQNSRLAADMERCGIDWEGFKTSYVNVAWQQIAATLETGREHRFADRFALAFAAAGLSRPLLPEEALAMATLLGSRIATACRPIDGASAAVHRLGKRYGIGLLSNYPEADVVRDSIAALDTPFDPIVVSGECGWAKPHPDAFAACTANLPFSPDEILFVGDDPVNDIEGAHAVGFRTCWIERPGPPPPQAVTDLRITSVRDLVEPGP